MIHIECVQGQEVWHWNRLGIPTASQFSRIMTQKKREYAAGARTYRNELLAEWILGIPHGVDASGFMDRGSNMEERAVAYYEMRFDVETTPGGVCLRDDRKAAASPDRLVGKKRGLEIKILSAHKHVEALLAPPDDYYAQVQGNLWITGREGWDLLLFNPGLPSLVIPFERDEKYIADFERCWTEFDADLLAGRQALLNLGAKPATALDAQFRSTLAMRPDAEDPF